MHTYYTYINIYIEIKWNFYYLKYTLENTKYIQLEKLIINSKTRGGNNFKETVRKEIQIINIRVEINHK